VDPAGLATLEGLLAPPGAPAVVAGGMIISGGAMVYVGGVTIAAGIATFPVGVGLLPVGALVVSTGGALIAGGVDVYVDYARHYLNLPEWFDLIPQMNLVSPNSTIRQEDNNKSEEKRKQCKLPNNK